VDTEQCQRLEEQVSMGGRAYIRNLAAAEAAVLRGQFNLAKVLRALAHSQRAQAMTAARFLTAEESPTTILSAVVSELAGDGAAGHVARTNAAEVASAANVRERGRDLALRSMTSLQQHSDVPETAVAQFICGCYSCGNLIEVTGSAPDTCDVCGALSPELARFEPFYSTSPEHLGQHTPQEIITIVAAGPDDVAAAVAGLDDATLRLKSSAHEWCAKEIVAHILETELLFNRRVNAILTHDGPGLPSIVTPVAPWKLHEGKGYVEHPVDGILARLHETRATTLSLLRPLTSAQWARRGSNVEGTASVLDLGTWLANHDLGHLVQLRRLCGRTEQTYEQGHA
jgi:hypothetical protein